MANENGSFYIRVIRKSGSPYTGGRVSCTYGILSGVETRYTDKEGWATFPIVNEVILRGGAIRITAIWVDVDKVNIDPFTPEDGDTFSFTRIVTLTDTLNAHGRSMSPDILAYIRKMHKGFSVFEKIVTITGGRTGKKTG